MRTCRRHPPTPIFATFLNNSKWGTLSKAFENSVQSAIKSEFGSLSSASWIFFRKVFIFLKKDQFLTNPCWCFVRKQSGRKETRRCTFPGFRFLFPVGTLDGSFVRSVFLPSCRLALQRLSSVCRVSFFASLSPSEAYLGRPRFVVTISWRMPEGVHLGPWI